MIKFNRHVGRYVVLDEYEPKKYQELYFDSIEEADTALRLSEKAKYGDLLVEVEK